MLKFITRIQPIFALCSLLAIPTVQAQIPLVVTSGTGNYGTDGAEGDISAPPSGSSSYIYVSTYNGVAGAGQTQGLGGTNGSSAQTSVFSGVANTSLTFSFDFVTTDSDSQDYATISLLNPDNSVAATLLTLGSPMQAGVAPTPGANDQAVINGGSAVLSPSVASIASNNDPDIGPSWSELGPYSTGTCSDDTGNGGCGTTGWETATFSFKTTGVYSLLFSVTNVGDKFYDTGLAIDPVANANLTAVPEARGAAVFAIGAFALIVVRRRKSALYSSPQ